MSKICQITGKKAMIGNNVYVEEKTYNGKESKR